MFNTLAFICNQIRGLSCKNDLHQVCSLSEEFNSDEKVYLQLLQRMHRTSADEGLLCLWVTASTTAEKNQLTSLPPESPWLTHGHWTFSRCAFSHACLIALRVIKSNWSNNHIPTQVDQQKQKKWVHVLVFLYFSICQPRGVNCVPNRTT